MSSKCSFKFLLADLSSPKREVWGPGTLYNVRIRFYFHCVTLALNCHGVYANSQERIARELMNNTIDLVEMSNSISVVFKVTECDITVGIRYRKSVSFPVTGVSFVTRVSSNWLKADLRVASVAEKWRNDSYYKRLRAFCSREPLKITIYDRSCPIVPLDAGPGPYLQGEKLWGDAMYGDLRWNHVSIQADYRVRYVKYRHASVNSILGAKSDSLPRQKRREAIKCLQTELPAYPSQWGRREIRALNLDNIDLGETSGD
ncbi:hypothetical protein J6590_026646 [Homalodisca vitripennis]|nr:hypothetical protein J6590_026646 [Homalodisca vitripennis]